MHFQYEAMHPFSDGNGRMGRILLLFCLKSEKLLDIPAIYLSKYIIKNKASYYKKLRLVTEKVEWEGWILCMLDMVETSSEKGLIRLEEILVLMANMSLEVK